MARWGSVLGLVILVAFCVVAVLLSSTHLRKLSIADEAAHIDSVFLVPDVARTGQKMLPETLDELSCRGGVQGADFVPPPCGSYQPEPYEGYPIGGGGYNTADIHPPTYYFITRVAITVAGWFVDADPVNLMRATGAIWLALGACLTWLLARRLGAGRWTAFGGAAILVAAPHVVALSSIVNIDATALPVGAGFALVALAAWRRKSVWWILPLAAAGVMLIKMTNLAGLIVVCLFLILREATRRIEPAIASDASTGKRIRTWWSTSGPGTSRAIGVGAVTAVGTAVASLGWSAIRTARALMSPDSLPISQWFVIDHLGGAQIFGVVTTFASPAAYAPTWVIAVEALPNLLQLGFVALLFGLTAASWFRDRAVFAALVASALTLFLAPSLYVVLNYVTSKTFFDPGPRYGFSMMPFLVASLAASLRSRAAGAALAGVGIFAMVNILATV